jgi:hypothetical protein
MALFARFSNSSISTGRTLDSTPIKFNGALVTLPVTLSSTTSNISPSAPGVGITPEFTANGALVTLPISLSSTTSNVTPSGPGLGLTPEFTANGALVTLPIKLSS